MLTPIQPIAKFSYKIFKPFEYGQMLFYGKFYGNYNDIGKGYICMCQNHNQLKRVIGVEYNFKPIIICKIDNFKLTKLKSKTSANGETYTHLYEPLNMNSILDTLHLDTNINDNTHYTRVINEINWHI